MTTVEEVFEELNFPSSQKLRRVLDSRSIAYDRKDVEKLVRREAVRQVQAPAYKFDGKIAARDINGRWFCDLIDFTAAPSDRGEKDGVRGNKRGRGLHNGRPRCFQSFFVDGSIDLQTA